MIARGARASRKRFAGILDQFNSLSAVVSPGRELWSVFEVSPLRLRLSLRRDLDAMGRAQRIIEWSRVLSSEQEVSPNFYQFINHALDLVDEGKLARAVAVYPRLLAEAGIMPYVGRCARCQCVFSADRRGSLGAGIGLICDRCVSSSNSLSWESIKVLQGGRCENGRIADEVEAFLSRWLEQEVGVTLKVRV